MKSGVDFAACCGDQGGGTFPATDSVPALGFPFEQFDPGSEDVHFALNSKPTLEIFDPALVLFLDHQWFAHINLSIYPKVYQMERAT